MLFAASVERAKAELLVYVVVDGSSLTLMNAHASKDFGPIGSPNCPARGLQVMNALGVSRHGVPVGLVEQIYWAWPPRAKRTRAEAAKRNAQRPFEEKETSNFVRAQKRPDGLPSSAGSAQRTDHQDPRPSLAACRDSATSWPESGSLVNPHEEYAGEETHDQLPGRRRKIDDMSPMVSVQGAECF